MMKPIIAMCNIFPNATDIREFAYEHAFSGIDWSFEMESIPKTPSEESRWVLEPLSLSPLEVRYHCPFYQMDIGHNDASEAKAAEHLFQRIIRLVSRAGGKYLSIHIGLGRNSTEPLSWDTTVDNLRRLVQYGAERHVRICLENLAWGWTSKPNLFEKLIRKSGAGVTLDIGHAKACESVQSQQYEIKDFVTPHPERVRNAHLYHTEISGFGHIPPKTLTDIQDRLALLEKIGCEWWAIEIKDVEGLLKTRKIVDEYLTDVNRGSQQLVKAS
jgi:sugar phosphate isomerase/epimerase